MAQRSATGVANILRPDSKALSAAGTETAAGRVSKGELTREALMAAGFRVFAERGFLRAQIGEIAREAGKSTGVFHIYFRNKEALLDAWVDRCNEAVPWYQADTDLLFQKAPHFLLQSYWSLYERFGPILEALDAAAKVSDHFQRRLADVRGKGDASIARMIRSSQSDGRCTGIDAELTAISIAAVITRTTAYWFRHRGEMEARAIDRAAMIDHLDALYEKMIGPHPASGAPDIASARTAVRSGP